MDEKEIILALLTQLEDACRKRDSALSLLLATTRIHNLKEALDRRNLDLELHAEKERLFAELRQSVVAYFDSQDPEEQEHLRQLLKRMGTKIQ